MSRQPFYLTGNDRQSRSLAGHRNQKAKEICYGQGDL
jgi:hypothetical protein